jgi:hypothetical protein
VTPHDPLSGVEERLFEYWYDAGGRRSYSDVAEHFDWSINEIRALAKRAEWEWEGDQRDAETLTNLQKLQTMVAARTEAVATIVNAHLVDVFARRLSPVLADGQPNPDYLPPGAIAIKEWLALVKFLSERPLTHASEHHEGRERQLELERIKAEIELLDAREFYGQGYEDLPAANRD